MIIKTASSIYEVLESSNLFRRIHQIGQADTKLPAGRWCRFQRMSPVVVGQPVRFFWILDEEPGAARIGLWATSPVIEVLPSSEADVESPAYLLPDPRSASRS